MNSSKIYRTKFLLLFFCCSIVANTKLCAQHFTTIKTDQGIEISESGKKVLFYQEQPKSVDGKYKRAGYVHPLYDFEENVLTEDAPADHPYHRGIFLAWHQIILNNKKIADGWMSENLSFAPVKLKIKKNEGSVTLQSEILWKSVLENKNVPVIKEETNITVHASTETYRAIDFDINLFALMDSLQIGGSEDIKGYGGFCVRLKLPKNISFISQNKEAIPQETAVEAGPWMDFVGSFDNDSFSKTGIAVFDNPANPKPHGQWILRKEGSMQNIPYPGRMPVILPKSGVRLRYRIIIQKNNLSSDNIQKLYEGYIHENL
jgi:hypothetical protein